MGASKDDKDVFPSPPTPPTLIRRIAWALDSFSPSSLLPSWFWAPTPPQKCQGDHFGRNKGEPCTLAPSRDTLACTWCQYRVVDLITAERDVVFASQKRYRTWVYKTGPKDSDLHTCTKRV